MYCIREKLLNLNSRWGIELVFSTIVEIRGADKWQQQRRPPGGHCNGYTPPRSLHSSCCSFFVTQFEKEAGGHAFDVLKVECWLCMVL